MIFVVVVVPFNRPVSVPTLAGVCLILVFAFRAPWVHLEKDNDKVLVWRVDR